MCSDISSLTVWLYPGTSKGHPVPDVPLDQPPAPCLDKALMESVAFRLFPPPFPWEENQANRLEEREPRHAPAEPSDQVTGVTLSQEACLLPRDSLNAASLLRSVDVS